jgi:hypothetical protein
MSARIPIVVGDPGTWEQLQPGDTLAATLSPPVGPPFPPLFVFETVSFDFAPIPLGGTVAPNPSGSGVLRAKASPPWSVGVAMAQQAVSPGGSGWFQTAGLFTLQDWTPIVGFNQLFPQALYFLDPANPGLLTRVRPVTPGQILQAVGVAVNTFTLSLMFAPVVLL